MTTPSEKTWLRVLGTTNEYQARLLVAEKAAQLDRGGISRLSRLTGMSRVTITQGLGELRGGKLRSPAEGRIRESGGGGKKVEQVDAELARRLKNIVEETTAGDPMSPLKWTSKSTRSIAEELNVSGHPISSVTVGRCLEDMGYTLQSNVKTREGPQHPNRDAQFRYINGQVQAFRRSGNPHGSWYLFPFSNRTRPIDPTRPVTTLKTAWESIREKAKVQCRFHDLQHTALTKMGEAGVPESTMLAIAGHMSRSMLERYSHIRMAAKREVVQSLSLSRAKSPEAVPTKAPTKAKLLVVKRLVK